MLDVSSKVMFLMRDFIDAGYGRVSLSNIRGGLTLKSTMAMSIPSRLVPDISPM
jgi:hypothetical protein